MTDRIFDSIVKEAGEFYKLTITVAIAFIGGTLLYSDKLVANPVKCLWVLFLGWALLVLSIIFIVLVRWKNIESGTSMLRGKQDLAEKLDRKKEQWTALSSICLICGIAIVAIFGAINMYYKNNQEDVMGKREERRDSIPFSKAGSENNSEELKRSIPFGSIEQPPKPKPSTESTSTTTSEPTSTDTTNNTKPKEK